MCCEEKDLILPGNDAKMLVGFLLVKIPPHYPEIFCNYGRTYHYHLIRDFPQFSDGKGPPQGRLP
jgi:hypothetical protein